MMTSLNRLFILLICTAAGTSACATAESNQAGDAGAQFDAASAGSDATSPRTDAGGPDATTNPVCSTGNEPCVTGCCAIAAPDALAPWTTGTIVATGTCRITEVMPYSCYPSTPGRDANGCCIGNYYGVANSTLTFSIAVLADRRHVLTTTTCTLGIGNNPSIAVCEITATATELVLGEPMQNPNAALKSTNFFPYVGPLSTSLPDGKLTVAFAGVADDLGSERCGRSVRYKSCTWTAP